jgi:glyoxylase-like metal-dependent hydrolase (beta-lactamase superfamily II)
LFGFDYALEPKKVNENTYCFFGKSEIMNKINNGNMSNSCYVDMGKSYLVIDSGPTYKYALQAHEKMKRINDLPISYVVNTHVHDDHWLGNAYYEEIGVKIIGTKEFLKETKVKLTRMEERITSEAYEKTVQIFPSIYVDDEMTLDIEGKKVHLIGVDEKAHTSGDISIHIPDYKIIFVGDLVFNDRLPSIRDGSLDGLLNALDKVRGMDVDYIIGGHGDIVDKSAIDFTYNYVKTLRDKIAKLIEEEKDFAEIEQELGMDEYKDVNLYVPMHRQNIEIAYRILEWESE